MIIDDTNEEFKTSFSTETKAFLRDQYSKSDVILEYGSGGSTVDAMKLGCKFVMSVESDKAWAERLNQRLLRDFDQDRFLVHYTDVGETGPWGMPRGNQGFRKYANYPLAVYDHERFVDPDLILVDGRFRIACFLTALTKIKKPTMLLWDDYYGDGRPSPKGLRNYYHWIERYFKPSGRSGNMAIFDIEPFDIPKSDIGMWVSAFNDPR